MIAKNNAIHIKSYAFAIRIVNAYKFLAESEKSLFYQNSYYAVELLSELWLLKLIMRRVVQTS